LQNNIKIGQIKGNPKKKKNIQQNKATQTLEISRKQTYGINVMDASHKVQAKRIFSSKEISSKKHHMISKELFIQKNKNKKILKEVRITSHSHTQQRKKKNCHT
jgi:hypothetical protein